MEKNKKNIIIKTAISIIPVLFFLFAVGYAIFMYFNNEDLLDQILRRDALIATSHQRDSLLNIENSNTASIITKYTSDCKLTINGKEVTLESVVNSMSNLKKEKLDLMIKYNELVDKYKDCLKVQIDEVKEGNNLRQSLINEKDSSQVCKYLLDYTQKRYGTDVYYYVNNKKQRFFTSRFSKADSANILYQAFGKVLSKDSTSGKWTIKK